MDPTETTTVRIEAGDLVVDTSSWLHAPSPAYPQTWFEDPPPSSPAIYLGSELIGYHGMTWRHTLYRLGHIAYHYTSDASLLDGKEGVTLVRQSGLAATDDP